jgi:hypothetical protein
METEVIQRRFEQVQLPLFPKGRELAGTPPDSLGTIKLPEEQSQMTELVQADQVDAVRRKATSIREAPGGCSLWACLGRRPRPPSGRGS